jgi:hypothetical protein
MSLTSEFFFEHVYVFHSAVDHCRKSWSKNIGNYSVSGIFLVISQMMPVTKISVFYISSLKHVLKRIPQNFKNWGIFLVTNTIILDKKVAYYNSNLKDHFAGTFSISPDFPFGFWTVSEITVSKIRVVLICACIVKIIFPTFILYTDKLQKSLKKIFFLSSNCTV